MAEKPSKLYVHLGGTPEEVVDALAAAGLLTPEGLNRRPELAETVKKARDSHAPRMGPGPEPCTGATVFSSVQTALIPYLNAAGRALAGQCAL